MPPKAADWFDETDWAWFAGVFEGEGCIEFHHKNSTALTISMTDEDVVRRCAEIAGVGSIMELAARRGHKVCWRWRVQKADHVLVVLDVIEPYLGKRRWARAQEARVRLDRMRRPGRCKRGHELNEKTRYVSPGGSTECDICRRERNAKNAQKRKATR